MKNTYPNIVYFFFQNSLFYKHILQNERLILMSKNIIQFNFIKVYSNN